MKEAYQEWYKCISDNANDKAIGIEAEVEIEIRGWDMQWLEGLLHLIRELEFNK